MAANIRKANKEDFPAILHLIREFAVYQQTPDKVTITVDQMIEDEHLFRCFVAENETGIIIGFATYFYSYYSWSGKAVYLDDLYVTSSYRGQGIGTQLLNKVIDTARTIGSKKLRWQVSNWNENAIFFYKKMGATIDEVEINCDLALT